MRDIVYCVFALVDRDGGYISKILMDICSTEEVALKRIEGRKKFYPETTFIVEYRFVEK